VGFQTFLWQKATGVILGGKIDKFENISHGFVETNGRDKNVNNEYIETNGWGTRRHSG
jgi:hypothetical protein